MYAEVTLTGKIRRGVSPAVGRAVLTPTVNTVSDMDGNEVIYGPLFGVLDINDGSFSITAPATDDPNLRPQNFGYTLKFELDEGVIPPIPEFSLPTAQPTIDITDILPDPANPTYVPTLAGPSNVLTVGTVTTGEPGTAVQVSIAGTSPEQVISFVIPKGTKGDQGLKGDKGNDSTITIGTTTTGAPGTGANVSNTGTLSNAILEFTIPRGDQGIQGLKGDKGDPGEVSLAQLNDGLATKLNHTNGTITGYKETAVNDADTAVGIDFNASNVVNATGAGAVTVTWANIPVGTASMIPITVRFASTVTSVIWPVGTKFSGGAAPTITGETWVTAVGFNGDVYVGLAWNGVA